MFGIGSSKSDRSFYEAFERHAAQIAHAMHPTEQHHLFVDVARAQLPARVGSIFEC